MSEPVPRRAIVLDAEALSQLASGRGRDTVARLAVARDRDLAVVYPPLVLTEVMTGGPGDAAVWRVANRIIPADVTTRLAATAGGLRERAQAARRKKRDLTVDAVVAATAIAWAPSLLVTGDAGDLSLLVEGHDVRVVPV